MHDAELVVLVDGDGTATGTAPKAGVHTFDTPLHLAFSCHVLTDDGRVLVTRRALSKTTWPGVWTNSFCGHPAPGEDIEDAVRRRAQHELGIRVHDLTLILPTFRYRAVDASGIVENELCPVYVAHTDDDLSPHDAEVADTEWVSTADIATSLKTTPWAFSPWFVLQAEQMDLYRAPTDGGRS